MLMLAFAAAIAAVPAAPTGQRQLPCAAPGGVFEARGVPAARALKLGELPPANHVLTVYREIDRCPAPVIVRYGIGTEAGR